MADSRPGAENVQGKLGGLYSVRKEVLKNKNKNIQTDRICQKDQESTWRSS